MFLLMKHWNTVWLFQCLVYRYEDNYTRGTNSWWKNSPTPSNARLYEQCPAESHYYNQNYSWYVSCPTLSCKAKRQYLLTCKVSRYYLCTTVLYNLTRSVILLQPKPLFLRSTEHRNFILLALHSLSCSLFFLLLFFNNLTTWTLHCHQYSSNLHKHWWITLVKFENWLIRISSQIVVNALHSANLYNQKCPQFWFTN